MEDDLRTLGLELQRLGDEKQKIGFDRERLAVRREALENSRKMSERLAALLQELDALLMHQRADNDGRSARLRAFEGELADREAVLEQNAGGVLGTVQELRAEDAAKHQQREGIFDSIESQLRRFSTSPEAPPPPPLSSGIRASGVHESSDGSPVDDPNEK